MEGTKAFRNYKNGHYGYGTIRTRQDITRAIREGKNVVLGGTRGYTFDMFLFLGIILIAVVIGVSISVYNDTGAFHIDLFLILLSIGFGFVLIGMLLLFKNQNRFIVLSPNGVVFRRSTGGISGYAWTELELELFQEHSKTKIMGMDFGESFSPVLYLRLPGENPFEIRFFKYTLKEFPRWKEIGENNLWTLCTLCFNMYYRYGRGVNL